MTHQQLDALTVELTAALEDLREQARHARRGADRRRAPGAGAKDQFPPADRVLAAVLYLRKIGTQNLLGQLFAVNRSTITRSVEEVRPLLSRHITPRQHASAPPQT